MPGIQKIHFYSSLSGNKFDISETQSLLVVNQKGLNLADFGFLILLG
jgi:hypothetical protein